MVREREMSGRHGREKERADRKTFNRSRRELNTWDKEIGGGKSEGGRSK